MGPIYLVKIHKIANNSATTEAGEKNKHRFWICRILEIFDVCLSKFENYQISHNKISHRFLGKGNSTWLFSAQRQQISAPRLLALSETKVAG
jgi:hypothetical protein